MDEELVCSYYAFMYLSAVLNLWCIPVLCAERAYVALFCFHLFACHYCITCPSYVKVVNDVVKTITFTCI